MALSEDEARAYPKLWSARATFGSTKREEYPMSTRSILKKDWKDYLDNYSKRILSDVVELDVESLDLGDQIEADWVKLEGMTYDPKDDMLCLYTESLRHFIAHPQSIWVIENGSKLSSIQIEDAEGIKHIVNIRDAESVRAHAARHPEQGHGAQP